jgi:bla regulator protein blaR1
MRIEATMRNDAADVLNFSRKGLPATAAVVVVAALVIAVLSPPWLRAQSLAPDIGSPAFEVASVKPNKSVDGRRGGSFAPGRFNQTSVTLRQLIQMAYGRQAFDVREISGGPSWIDSDRFDIVAKADGDLRALYLPDGKGSPGLAYLMLRTLLAERFRLVVHAETRELPVYALVMARRDGRTGPQLRRSDVDCAAITAASAASVAKTGRLPASPGPGKGPPCSIGPRPGHLTGNAASLSQLAAVLSSSVNRVVLDRTGLTGAFDLNLDWTPDQPPPPTDAARAIDRPADPGLSIFTALQEQLGLKLESTKGPVDVIVIDRAEQPTPD